MRTNRFRAIVAERTIAELLLPANNPPVSLLITFSAFGLAYFVRPCGRDHHLSSWPGGDKGAALQHERIAR
jgi:hypothetical protein